MKPFKIAILAKSHFSAYSHAMISPITNDPFLQIVACIIYFPKEKSTADKLKASWAKGRRSAILVIILELIAKKITNIWKTKKSVVFNTGDFFSTHSTDIYQTNKLYSSDSLLFMKESQADLLILLEYHGIVKPEIINLFPSGGLSYHYGNMRKYRGQPAGFRELYRNENEMGVTLQRIGPGIDNGQPLEEISIPLKKTDNLRTISDFVEANCPPMMHLAIRKIQKNYSPPPIEYGPVYTVPTLWQWLFYHFKMSIRRAIK